jgi:hypothetical protein
MRRWTYRRRGGHDGRIQRRRSRTALPRADRVRPRAGSQSIAVDSPSGTSTEEKGKSEIFVAPFPVLSPQLGWGALLVGGWIVDLDKENPDTPASVLSAGGFYSENDSWLGVGGFKGYLDGDRWRVLAVGGLGRINYDFFGVGSGADDDGLKIPLRTDTAGGMLESLGRIAPNTHFGPRFQYAQVESSIRNSAPLPPEIEQNALDTTDVALGLHLQADTRDDTFYPTDGILADVEVDVFNDAIGSDFNFEQYALGVAGYPSLDRHTVLAWRGVARLSSGDAPFYRLSQYDLRGYEIGRYRDDLMLAAEVELRRKIWKRLGAVAFAGIGQVAPSLEDLNADEVLLSGGVGLRFRLTEKNALNYRVDVAWGRNGSVFYMSLSEAF